jgi:hypothetical protein
LYSDKISVFKYDVKKNILQDAKPLHESWFPCFNYPNPYSSCSNKIIKMSGYANNEDDNDSEHYHRHNYQNHRDNYHRNHQKGYRGHDHHNQNERNPHNHKGHDNHYSNQNRG